ncbi:phosphotransferase [Clostridium sp. E02]|uniref:phosphotransferase family protein n=1 Tax=Clostridium sp. E02 TaxID=2487134 RepID=UPI000F51CFA8|nr:phosphotransferase [Clostridium sp. E02]
MKSRTKNNQTQETLNQMILNAFPQRISTSITELTEGYFNVAYRIAFEDGESVILKIAPPAGIPVMSYEKDMMKGEVMAMRIAAKSAHVPVAKILYYNEQFPVLNSPYFFMEFLEGQSFHLLKDQLSDEIKKKIKVNSGKLNRTINEITGEAFGYISQPDTWGPNWYSVFSQMINLALSDARQLSIDLKISTEKLLHQLKLSQYAFLEVTTPKLVHWDLWDGNLLIKDDRISGLIDWERALWGDPLMEAGFRSYGNSEDFKEGYQVKNISKTEQVRILWYDLYTLLLMAQECDYRRYDTRDMYDWATNQLKETLNTLTLLQEF